MNLYLVRHGETDYNLKGVYYGWTDCDVNEKGLEQAKKLSEFFKSISYDRIISSTLQRAVTTAEIIKSDKNVPYLKYDGIKEINFGNWEDRLFSDIEKNDPVNCKAWWTNWMESRIPNGETFLEFYARVTKCLKEIIKEFDGEDIVIVSHSGALSVMLCELIGAGPHAFWKFRTTQETYSHVKIIQGDVIIEKINSPLVI